MPLSNRRAAAAAVVVLRKAVRAREKLVRRPSAIVRHLLSGGEHDAGFSRRGPAPSTQPSGSVWASASIVVGLIEMRIIGNYLAGGCSMSGPGSRTKRSSSSVKGRTSSRSMAATILRSSLLSSWRAASRSGVTGEDGSSGVNLKPCAAAEGLCPPTINPLPRCLSLARSNRRVYCCG